MIFEPFPKMARLSREVIVTEKIDGTCGCIAITENGEIYAGSRSQWITEANDNFGFAAWVMAHRETLIQYLGVGRHFGEWWGHRIQRGYGLSERRFSLFNAARWCPYGETPQEIPTGDPRIVKIQDVAPPCCEVVPVLYRGVFTTQAVEGALWELCARGSQAAPGFEFPEGVVVYHIAGGVGFKKTIEKDDLPKSRSARL